MTDTTVNTNLAVHEAYERVHPEMVARGESNLPAITLDIQTATATGRGAIVNILPFREQLHSEVPKFDVTLLDKLDTYAQALLQAEANYRVSTAPPEALVALGENGVKLRALLLSDAIALVNRELLNSKSLDNLKGPNGYRNISSDILTVSTLLRTNWSTISSKTGVTLAELDQAETLADQLNESFGIREQTPAKAAAAALERQQAYALFIEAYDQIRRAVSFLRWDKGDADTIAPSLYAANRNSTHKKSGADTTVTTEPVVHAPVTAGAVTQATNATPATTAPATTTKAAPGLPGADPFAS
jgi:hypothetical protein